MSQIERLEDNKRMQLSRRRPLVIYSGPPKDRSRILEAAPPTGALRMRGGGSLGSGVILLSYTGKSSKNAGGELGMTSSERTRLHGEDC